ncbi:MAG TPA: thioesterase family protein [Parvibaculum sp.]|jgi:acyl-CoA thioester hydrolase
MIDSYRGYVSMQECDEMGHMNIQHYIGKTSDAGFSLRAALGIGASRQAVSGTGYVALEHHIRFHRELKTSDLVLIRSGIIEVREKTFRKYQEMREVLDDRLAATFVVDVGCLDFATRRLTAWPGETRAKAEALMMELPDHAAPRGLYRETIDRDVSLARADADGMIESNRSAVNPWECDTNAHMNARFIMARFSDAQGHMWAHAGLGRHQQAEAGLATATVEMRLVYFRELTAGDTLIVRTGLVEAGAKTLRYRHWMFNAETGEAVCAAEGLGLLFDKQSRKAVSIPQEVARRFARA